MRHWARWPVALVDLIQRRTISALVVLGITGLTLGVLFVHRQKASLVETSAARNAELYSQALSEFRTLYTSQVVSRAVAHGMSVVHDYQESDGAIPLPATLSMELGKSIGAHQSGAKTRLYSPYPFPWRAEEGGLRDEFARDAWNHLREDSSKPFFRFENHDGIWSIRYATADLMRPSCVNCHNTHAQTPKNDWKAGDLRGVLEIVHPIDGVLADARASTTETGLVLGLLFALLLISLALVVKWHRRNSVALEETVRERTNQLDATNRELAHAQKLESIGHLAAGIAHEINTPTQYVGDNTRFLRDAFDDLAPAMAKSEQLLEAVRDELVCPELSDEVKAAMDQADLAYLKEEIPRAIQESLNGIDRVTKIVRAMKEFSHPAGREKVPTDISRAIESTIMVATNEWKYVADVVTDFDPELPTVSCHPGDLNQALLNIIVNAAQAIAEAIGDDPESKGTIEIKTRKEGDWAEIRIRDTGSGIPDEACSKIFDPFFTTKDVGKGTGQGLSIAHTVVVRKHSGSIHCETERGVGTTFVIRLPLGAVATTS